MAHDFRSAAIFNKKHKLFSDISFKAFAEPGDEKAIQGIKSIPGAPQLLSWWQKNVVDAYLHLSNSYNHIRVTARTYPALYELVQRCCEVLSCPMPEVYVGHGGGHPNASAGGVRRTVITIYLELLDLVTPDELAFVIGHEIGHLKAGHALYKNIGDELLTNWDSFSAAVPVPGLSLARTPLTLAVFEWSRRAEFTCDRAGLLCCQDVDVACSALSKLAGGIPGLEEDLDLEELSLQSGNADDSAGVIARLLLAIESLRMTHPYIPVRIKHIREYAKGEEYAKILKGEYAKDLLGEHEMGERIVCRGCGADINKKLDFCPNCGKPTAESLASEIECPGCKVSLPADARFCPKCGTKVSDLPPVKQNAGLLDGAGSDLKQGMANTISTLSGLLGRK